MDCNFQQSDYLIKPLQEQMIKRLDLLRSAIVNEDWQKATTEMLDSNWARQTKRRSARLSQMMLLGKWID